MKEPFSYGVIPEIRSIPRGLLKTLHIDEILYSFVDLSGNRSVLTTDPLLLDINFYKREFKLSEPLVNLRLANDPGSWKANTMSINANPKHCDFVHAATLKEREANLFQVCLFSRNFNGTREIFELYSHENDPNTQNFALSHEDILQHAYQFFLDQTFSLRKNAQKEPLVKTLTVPKTEITPLSLSKENVDSDQNYPIRRYFLHGATHEGEYLTAQEARCLKLLFQCRSTTQIGKTLGLSSRTVEHYINQVKLKLDCSTKAELYDVLMSLGFHKLQIQSF